MFWTFWHAVLMDLPLHSPIISPNVFPIRPLPWLSVCGAQPWRFPVLMNVEKKSKKWSRILTEKTRHLRVPEECLCSPQWMGRNRPGDVYTGGPFCCTAKPSHWRSDVTAWSRFIIDQTKIGDQRKAEVEAFTKRCSNSAKASTISQQNSIFDWMCTQKTDHTQRGDKKY